MSATNITLGEGLGDAGTAWFSSATSDYITSDVTTSNTGTYVSGGFDSLGNSYTSRPILVVDVTVRVGGTGVGGPTSTGSYQPLLSTQSDGTPSTVSGGNTTPGGTTVSAGTDSNFKFAGFSNTKYYYGFRERGVGSNIVYARGGTSGSIYQNGTLRVSSSRISGRITQASIPNAPTLFAVNAASITPTGMQFTWTAPTDDGGDICTIKGYRINYKANSASLWSVLVPNTLNTTTSVTVGGLSPSTNYDFQVAALNDTTDLHNASNYDSITAHVGVRSETVSVTTLADHQLKVWVGGEFKKGVAKVWDGSQFKTVANTNASVWTGSAFKNVKIT
jgi:hypothetical protein